jgi:AcrR family transcriptional regulator
VIVFNFQRTAPLTASPWYERSALLKPHDDRSEPRRADAQRNREAVIEAAMVLLAQRPGASMGDIADASGLGRTTVYRHFPSRDELMNALFARVVEDGREMAAGTAASSEPTLEALRGLGPKIVEIGERYRFLDSHRHIRDAALGRAQSVGKDPLEDYLAAAQGRGELRDDVPVPWMLGTIRALGIASVDQLIAGNLTPAQAGELLGNLLVDVFSPRG